MDLITILRRPVLSSARLRLSPGPSIELHEIRSKWKDADVTIPKHISKLTSLRAALNKISEWISSNLANVPQHHQLVVDLERLISCCRVLI